jgi:P2 family phage contractile tail tube protein
MKVPEKLINFRVYQNGNDMVGVADVELPSLEAMTETVKGAGLAGEIDSPVLGHYSSMELTLNWRTLEKNNVCLASPDGVSLDLRGAQQVYDSNVSKYVVRPVKCVIRGMPKKTELGKLDVGATTDTSNVIETTYIKITIDGETVLELDKYNYICNIGGFDF